MNWHIWKCSGIVCSCSTERGIRERENEMSGIVIEKVRKSFDTKDGVVEALKDVNLNIDSGDIYGIIGMSGAGKSTLVRCMNFLEVPTEGQVLIYKRKEEGRGQKEGSRAFRNRWSGGQAECLSCTALRWSEAEGCHCKSTCIGSEDFTL